MELNTLFEAQRDFFLSHHTIPAASRIAALKALSKAIKQCEGEILQALELDLGKSGQEAYMTEIGQVYDEIRVQIKNCRRWSSEKFAWSPLSQFPASSSIQPVPYGNVLIISPWNYPFSLCLTPLVDALSAGNTAIIKPSELSSHTSAVVAKVIALAFDPEYVAVVEGDAEVTQRLLDHDFDFIFFTGSERVGKIVLEKASAHLTPTALELGGKSPCIVDETANLSLAARRIVWGKFINAGQTCVAPDYILVHESVAETLIQLLKHQIELQYPDASKIGKIISERHYDRLIGMLEKANIAYGGLTSKNTLQITPTLVYPADWKDPLMKEEIFGPILPIITYDNFYTLMAHLQKLPTPLACYLFTQDDVRKDFIKEVLPFGGGCINDVVIQVANPSIPFGGMKQSGMGQYHGKYGFMTFSHQKGMMEKYALEFPVRYSYFNENFKNALLKGFFRAP